jgi:DNA-binding transcriptional MerR regulator
VSEATGLPQHVLRYWETRFPQLRPVTRAGNRRYYRPADVALVRRIDALLNAQGYTVRGVQQVLTQSAHSETGAGDGAPDIFAALRAIRDDLGRALTQDDDTA